MAASSRRGRRVPLTDELAEAIAARVREQFPTCTAADVKEVAARGGVEAGTVSEDYDSDLSDRLIVELDEEYVDFDWWQS